MTIVNLQAPDKNEVKILPSTYEVPELYQSKPLGIGFSRFT